MKKKINEIGNVYGYLTVIERAENSSDGRARWLCQCKCGNTIIVEGKKLRNGNTKSCGCYQKERAIESNINRGGGDLTGQRFGHLVVLGFDKFIEKSNGKRVRVWKCQCDCGNICYVQHQYLKNGDTQSCGCNKSHGENDIELLLKNNNINFQREYQFDDLIDKNPLRFDFAIIKNNTLLCLIEFQGEQHWKQSNGFFNTDIIKHDKMKKEYCKLHNIPLYYFYYKERSAIQVNKEELFKIKEINNYNEL